MSRTGRNLRRENASSLAQGSAGELPPTLFTQTPPIPIIHCAPLILMVQIVHFLAIPEENTLLPFQSYRQEWNYRSLSILPPQGSAVPPADSAGPISIPQSPRPLRMKPRSVGHIAPGDVPLCVVAFKFTLIIGRVWIHSKSSTASPRNRLNLSSFHSAAGERKNVPPPVTG